MSESVHIKVVDLFERHVLVCCGPGGVGKTTTAAALAIAGAQLGKRVCVITIDPAKRLANAMGLEQLTNNPVEVHGVWPGEVWALMLDVKETFDDVVKEYAASTDQINAILSNKLYADISETLSGTHEYLAMEKLFALTHDDRFDVIVVDTAPSRRALDFLDSSNRLSRFLENKLFRMIVFPSKSPLRLVGIGAQAFLKVTAKVVGAQVVSDAIDFFRVFSGMEHGFRERANVARSMLASDAAAFIIVSSGEAGPLHESAYFVGQLRDKSIVPVAMLFNRLEPDFGNVDEIARALVEARRQGALDLSKNPTPNTELPVEYRDALVGNYDDIAARRHAQDVAIDDFLTDQVALEAGRKLVIKRIDRKASDIATMDALVDFADHLLLPDR